MRRISTFMSVFSLALGLIAIPSFADDVKVKDKVKRTDDGYTEKTKVRGDGIDEKTKTKTKVHHGKVRSKTKVTDHGKTVYTEKEKTH